MYVLIALDLNSYETQSVFENVLHCVDGSQPSNTNVGNMNDYHFTFLSNALLNTVRCQSPELALLK